MQTIEVKVQRDYLERLATSKSPVSAIAELIWNALDADATVVDVRLHRNSLGGLDSIEIEDNGHGLSASDAVAAFESLGGSSKRKRSRTPSGRILHGQQGKGRFQAFALGSEVEWHSRYAQDGKTMELRVQGNRSNLRRFTTDDPIASAASGTGTLVSITGVDRKLGGLESDRGRQILTEEFALYLREYDGLQIVYDGTVLEPSSIEESVTDYSLEVTLESGETIIGELTIIEWSISTERALYLCDEYGFTLHKLQPGI